MGHLIFIVDDEPDIRAIISYYFKKEGHEAMTFENPALCLHALGYIKPDVIISDWLMPGMSGQEFCRHLKQNSSVADIPFLMISCKSEENDIISALEAGVDDYLVKPFSLKILNARMQRWLGTQALPPATSAGRHNILNNTNSIAKMAVLSAEEDESEIAVNNLRIDKTNHQVWVNNQHVDLTFSEFRLLALLADTPGRVFTREQIIRHQGGQHYAVTERAVDVKVVGLRKKLQDARVSIKTIRSVGYKLIEA